MEDIDEIFRDSAKTEKGEFNPSYWEQYKKEFVVASSTVVAASLLKVYWTKIVAFFKGLGAIKASVAVVASFSVAVGVVAVSTDVFNGEKNQAITQIEQAVITPDNTITNELEGNNIIDSSLIPVKKSDNLNSNKSIVSENAKEEKDFYKKKFTQPSSQKNNTSIAKNNSSPVSDNPASEKEKEFSKERNSTNLGNDESNKKLNALKDHSSQLAEESDKPKKEDSQNEIKSISSASASNSNTVSEKNINQEIAEVNKNETDQNQNVKKEKRTEENKPESVKGGTDDTSENGPDKTAQNSQEEEKNTVATEKEVVNEKSSGKNENSDKSGLKSTSTKGKKSSMLTNKLVKAMKKIYDNDKNNFFASIGYNNFKDNYLSTASPNRTHGISLGLDYKFKTARKLNLELGLHVFNKPMKNTRYGKASLVDSSWHKANSYMGNPSFDTTYTKSFTNMIVLEIPVNISYTFKGKHTVGAGISFMNILALKMRLSDSDFERVNAVSGLTKNDNGFYKTSRTYNMFYEYDAHKRFAVKLGFSFGGNFLESQYFGNLNAGFERLSLTFKYKLKS